MIDLHIHILPGIDDGPATSEDARSRWRGRRWGRARGGSRRPRTSTPAFDLRAADLAAARERLAARLAAEGIRLPLLQGGEIAAERLPLLDDAELTGLTLGGGGTVLLECPFAPIGGAMEPMVADLRERGFGVLLGHPERSPTFQRDARRLARAGRARRERPDHRRVVLRALRHAGDGHGVRDARGRPGRM